MSTVKIAEREFEIGEPDATHLVRILNVVGNVGTRAENVAAQMGKRLFERITGETPGDNEWLGTLFPFLAALTPEDFLKLMAALLQFDSEQEGVKWLSKNKPKLNDVVNCIVATLDNLDGIITSLQNFTPVFRQLRAIQAEPEAEPPSVQTG